MEAEKIFIVGIGGIGLSALAQLLAARGAVVSGSDRDESPTTTMLKELGISVVIGHSAQNVPAGTQLLIYSDAVYEDNPERMRAKELGIPQRSYFEALGSIANESPCLIAVAGAHGKTTTTAMLVDVLEVAGLNPTAIVGSLRTKTRSNFLAGGRRYFVVEADEHLRHFLHLQPRILAILNIDADHLDYYKDLADIQSAFRELVQKVPRDGFVVCDPSLPNVQPVIKGLACTVVDYKKYFDPELPLKILPLNRINAAAVLAVSNILKVDVEAAKRALAEFSGTWRRFEYKGTTKNGVLVYDDYAHHPAEIQATLRSVREQFPGKKTLVAFHPHLYSRTKLLLNEFAAALAGAGEVLVAPIFAAREEPDPSISNTILAERIKSVGVPARAVSLKEVAEYIRGYKGAGDIIITMGAGDIYKAGEDALK